MNPQFDFSPVSLGYIGALRHVRPRRRGSSFAYALAECRDFDALTGLAASNPEGHFYGLVEGEPEKTAATRLAEARGVRNVTFLAGSLGALVAAVEDGVSPLPPLQYLCCDERDAPLAPDAREDLFALAAKLLLPGGMFGYGYRAYAEADDSLHFLVQEFAPEMDVAQAEEFLGELKRLGPLYFGGHPEAAARIDRAIRDRQPDYFFSVYDGAARSATFDTITALRPRGFVYIGDAEPAMNYVELAAPPSSHRLILECRDNPLYETIKDFALNRLERCDVWCKPPAEAGDDPAELFGGFAFGIVKTRDEVPGRIETRGEPIDLRTPLFAKLIDLMTLIPLGIGDFLLHPDGQGFAPADVMAAMQILVAGGIARPMRGHSGLDQPIDSARPRLSGSYNRYLDQTPVTAADVLLASPIIGSAVTVPPREALVMQALDRAGLADSVSALLPELQRLAKNPVTAARVMDSAEPTPETAQHIIKDVVAQSMVQWYAYGLVAAA
ncbi:MAG TPA: methyltransferase regulatory domain-containing protein [Alphaproteobacteria bacterium]|nr:methyltransferase regulatory domain-containing protein [Alphaproteobacteria bacterium]